MSTIKIENPEDGTPKKRGRGRPKTGVNFVRRQLAVIKDDHANWLAMSQLEGISLSQWVRERCRDVSGAGLIRMQDRLLDALDGSGESARPHFAEWEQLAKQWLGDVEGQVRDIKARLKGLSQLP